MIYVFGVVKNFLGGFVFSLIVFLTSTCMAINVDTVEAFQEALNDKMVTNIHYIGKGVVKGNFIIPTRILLIEGNPDVVFIPANPKKCLFDTESDGFSPRETIGRIIPLVIKNLNIRSENEKDKALVDLWTGTRFDQCNFSNSKIRGYSGRLGNLFIDCKFDSSIVESKGTCFKVQNCCGNGLEFTMSHEWDSYKEDGKFKEIFKIDEHSILNVEDFRYAHKDLFDEEEVEEILLFEKPESIKFVENLVEAYEKVTRDIDNESLKQGYNACRTMDQKYFVLKQLMDRELKTLDFADSDLKQGDIECIIRKLLEYHLGIVNTIVPCDIEIGKKLPQNFAYDFIDSYHKLFVDNIGVRKALINTMLRDREKFAVLKLFSPNVYLINGNANFKDYYKAELGSEKTFKFLKNKLGEYRTWNSRVIESEKNLQHLLNEGFHNIDAKFYANVAETMLNLKEYRIALGEFVRMTFFDIPMQITFTNLFVRIEELKDNWPRIRLDDPFWGFSQKSKEKIKHMIRDVGPFYGIRAVGVLLSTNDLRHMFLKRAKRALAVEQTADVEAYLMTDHDLLRDKKDMDELINNFE